MNEENRNEDQAAPTAGDDGGTVTAEPSDENGGEFASKADEYLRMAQRAQADLVNYRRRVDQEREEIRGAARIDAAVALLPILDDFERALSAIPEDQRQQGWVQGILLIERNLRSQVERAGLQRIDAEGKPFDPWEHEAIMTDASGQHEDDTVTAVIRPGYRAGNRVVRPAQVSVARRAASS